MVTSNRLYVSNLSSVVTGQEIAQHLYWYGANAANSIHIVGRNGPLVPGWV